MIEGNTDNYYILSFDSRNEQHINVISGPLSKVKASFNMKAIAEKELDNIMFGQFCIAAKDLKYTSEKADEYRKECWNEYLKHKCDSRTLAKYLDGYDMSFSEDAGTAMIRNYMDDWIILWEVKEIG